MKIYNLGSLNIDYVYSVEHFVSAGETLASGNMQTFAGGKGLNQSIAAARAGSKVIHGGIIGQNGEFLKEIMVNSGVDVSRVKSVSSPSGHAIIQVDTSGQNSILLYGGTNLEIDREYVENFLFDAQAGDILVLQNEISNLNVAFDIAERHKMQIAFNPSPFDKSIKELPLHLVKWWFCNETEGASLWGSSDPYEIAERFVREYPDSNLILTLGSNGSLFKNCDTIIEQPIYQTNVVDTTAAGDTFTGFFISEIANGSNIAKAMDTASKASAITVSRKGAAPSIPYKDEIN